MFYKVKFAFVLLVCSILSACQSNLPPLNSMAGALKIENIEVSLAVSPPPGSFISQRLFRFSQYRLMKRSSPSGLPVNVYIQITEIHRKDAVMSLIAGDANRMAVNLTIVDSTGRPLIKRQLTSSTAGAINGVIGAVAAAAADGNDVDDQLADDMASQIERNVYGEALQGRLTLPPQNPDDNATKTSDLVAQTAVLN